MAPSGKTQSKVQRRKSAPKTSPSRPRLQILLAACALIALVCIAYGNSIPNNFVWDDHQQIVMNPALKPPTPITHIFSSDIRFAHQDSSNQNHTYRPLQMLTYRIVGATFGFTPTPFHLCNLALAIAGALAAFAVFYLLLQSTLPALAVASLFAVYPIHTEAVDWIAASPDLGCGLFLLLSFAFFLASRKPASPEAKFPYWHLPSLSLAAFFISLFWKEPAATFPLLIATYVFLIETLIEKPSETRLRAALKASAPYVYVLSTYLLIRTSVLGSLTTSSRNWALSPFQFFLTALHLMLSYWCKLALPTPLNAYYTFSPVRSLSDPRAIAAILLLPPTIAGLIYVRRKLLGPQAPLCAFAALWVCITLLPALNIYALGRNVFAERYLYLPSVGFCLLATVAASAIISIIPTKARKPTAILLTLLVISWFTAETITRNPDWKDDKTLFSETLLRSPNAPFVRNMVALSQSSDSPGSPDAEQNYLQSIALSKQETPPDRLDLLTAYKGLATLYADRADNQQALQMLSQAREIAPSDPEEDSEEGLILVRAGRWSEAEPLLNKTIAAHPENENVLSTLGLVAWQYHHDLNKALEWFNKALAAHPEQDDFTASVHNNLGAVYGELNDSASSIAQFKLAIAIAPRDPEYHANLANALGAANHYDEARAEAEAALQIAPDYPPARAVLQNLGIK